MFINIKHPRDINTELRSQRGTKSTKSECILYARIIHSENYRQMWVYMFSNYIFHIDREEYYRFRPR